MWFYIVPLCKLFHDFQSGRTAGISNEGCLGVPLYRARIAISVRCNYLRAQVFVDVDSFHWSRFHIYIPQLESHIVP